MSATTTIARNAFAALAALLVSSTCVLAAVGPIAAPVSVRATA